MSVFLALAMVFSLGINAFAEFSDVTEEDWFSKAVNFVTEKNYFTGVSTTEFDPNGTMTRGMFVTVLGRLANVDCSEYTRDKFKDVIAEEWYYSYVTWASETGLTSGFPDGNFYPDEPVNREQVAVFIDRYLGNNGITLDSNPNAFDRYSDEDNISTWALDAVGLMRETAIFTGDQYGRFQPQQNAKRAEIANAIMRLTTVMNGELLNVPERLPDAPPEPPEQIEATPEPVEHNSRAQEILSGMSLKEKVYQMFMVTPEQLTGVTPVTAAGQKTQNALTKQPVGGLWYSSKNLTSDYQLINMLNNTKSYTNITPFIAVEEESSNRSQLLPKLEIQIWNSMYEYGDMGEDKAYEIGSALGRDIAKYGFNMNFAPVADVWSNAKNTIIGDRAFSSLPDAAAVMAAAEARGLQDNGVSAVLKHYPGYGDVRREASKLVSKKTLEQLRQTEFVPFKAGIDAGADCVMCAHINVDAVDPDAPASMSGTFINDLLRGELGFNGVVITDRLDSDEVKKFYSPVDAAVNCINAGADMLLCPDNFIETANEIVLAVANGDISIDRINQSVERILTAKINRGIIQ